MGGAVASHDSSDSEALSSDSLLCEGAYGRFEGSSRDQVVMGEYRTLGTWAKGLVSLVVDRLFGEGGGTFIDVGANIGLVSVPVVERTGSIGIAFEPEPRNFGYLTRNVHRHGLTDRIECRATACYSRPARLSLSLSDTNLGDHRLQREGVTHSDREVIEVSAERLDDVLRGRDLPRPIVLKIDAQGSEVCIFEGAVETLARADYVVTEYWPEGVVAHGESARGFEQHLRQFPFGAVLHVLPLPEPLNSSEHVFSQLSWIESDGSDPGFFDLLFSRQWVLPNAPPEMELLKRALAEQRAKHSL